VIRGLPGGSSAMMAWRFTRRGPDADPQRGRGDRDRALLLRKSPVRHGSDAGRSLERGGQSVRGNLHWVWAGADARSTDSRPRRGWSPRPRGRSPPRVGFGYLPWISISSVFEVD
jgi:hypothetical protein